MPGDWAAPGAGERPLPYRLFLRDVLRARLFAAFRPRVGEPRPINDFMAAATAASAAAVAAAVAALEAILWMRAALALAVPTIVR